MSILVKTDSVGICGHPVVYGNAAPVQLSPSDKYHPGRILVPHTVNNFEVTTLTLTLTLIPNHISGSNSNPK